VRARQAAGKGEGKGAEQGKAVALEEGKSERVNHETGIVWRCSGWEADRWTLPVLPWRSPVYRSFLLTQECGTNTASGGPESSPKEDGLPSVGSSAKGRGESSPGLWWIRNAALLQRSGNGGRRKLFPLAACHRFAR